MNEAALNAAWLRKDLTTLEAQSFSKDVLNHMRERLSDYQEQYGDLYNLEATPAESTSYRLAKHDTERFGDIITAAKPGDVPYYTNSSHLPVGYTSDLFDALTVQDDLQTLYTSGTVFHAFLGEKLPDWKAAAALVRKIAENFKLPYYTLSPTYSVCAQHGYLTGEHFACPHCGKPAEVYSRITGYYRPVQNWNNGKTQEYKDRKLYALGTAFKPHAPSTSAQAARLMPGFAAAPSAQPSDPEQVSTVRAMRDAVNELFLFTTKTCPNCKIAKEGLEQAGLAYTLLDVSEHLDLARKYRIMQAPTLLVRRGDKMEAVAGAPDICKLAAAL